MEDQDHLELPQVLGQLVRVFKALATAFLKLFQAFDEGDNGVLFYLIFNEDAFIFGASHFQFTLSACLFKSTGY
jgi:hypothetical protein